MNTAVIASGMLIGAGIAGVAYSLMPKVPHLGDALQRLSPETASTYTPSADTVPVSRTERLGYSVHRRLINVPGLRVPASDLRLIDRSTGWFLGRKAGAALVGLLLPPILSLVLLMAGTPVSIAIPALLGPILAIGLWFVPDIELAGMAKVGRNEHARAVAAYIELVALHLVGGLMPSQALDDAAQIGTGPVFTRLAQELERAGWDQEPKWRALQRLAKELELPELADLANIAQLADEEGAEVATALRERARALINAQLEADKKKAGDRSELAWLPTAILAGIFAAILITPLLLSIAGGGSN